MHACTHCPAATATPFLTHFLPPTRPAPAEEQARHHRLAARPALKLAQQLAAGRSGHHVGPAVASEHLVGAGRAWGWVAKRQSHIRKRSSRAPCEDLKGWSSHAGCGPHVRPFQPSLPATGPTGSSATSAAPNTSPDRCRDDPHSLHARPSPPDPTQEYPIPLGPDAPTNGSATAGTPQKDNTCLQYSAWGSGYRMRSRPPGTAPPAPPRSC